METGAPPQAVQDLVETTSERRLRNAFEDNWLMMYRFPGDAYYREWQLRADTNAPARIVESSDVADRLFPFLLNDDPQTRILWLSETHHLLCEGPNEYRDEAILSQFLDEMNCHTGEMNLDLRLRDSSKWYHVVLDNFVGTLRPGSNQREFEEAPDLVTLLLQMLRPGMRALATFESTRGTKRPPLSLDSSTCVPCRTALGR
jgi:hypothetical protein